MNKQIITIETIPEVIDWGNMQYQLDDKTILHYIEIVDYAEDEDGFEIPDIFNLSFTFYDCHYISTIYWQDVLDNEHLVFLEGPGILITSFEDHLQYEHWNLISTLIKKLVNEQNN